MTTLTLQNLEIDNQIKTRKQKARHFQALAGIVVIAFLIISGISTIHNIQSASVLKYQASCSLYSNQGASYWYECPTDYSAATTAQQLDYVSNK